ncbi:hypothetical protein PQX77_012380 [Marasmius sp. AFHP31]|nr:hypothetical protein PQX77_012380 [Marasmius sp. AFHP31]
MYVKVENQLFKIHRHFLRQESPIFDSMFDSPPPVEGQEGETEDRPIILPEITCDQFVALMNYFYKGTFFKTKEPGTSFKEYQDLLSIATLYECSEARQKAILGVESYNPIAVEKIVLAEKYNVDHWLMPAYIQLCKRDSPLTRDEAWDIGLDKAIMIAAAREKIRFSEGSKNLISPGRKLSANSFEDSRVERYYINEELHPQLTPFVQSKEPSPTSSRGSSPPRSPSPTPPHVPTVSPVRNSNVSCYAVVTNGLP